MIGGCQRRESLAEVEAVLLVDRSDHDGKLSTSDLFLGHDLP